jgi:hypothetical protein
MSFGSMKVRTWRLLVLLAVGGAVALLALLFQNHLSALWSQWVYWARVGHGETDQPASRSSIWSHPALAGLPLKTQWGERATWATPAVREQLVQSKPRQPEERAEIDLCLAWWDFHNGRLSEAEAEFRRLGDAEGLVRLAARRGDTATLRHQAENRAVPPAARALAWAELARLLDRGPDHHAAARCYLNALENAPVTGDTHLIGWHAWEAVRTRVGTDITLKQYAASLEVLAARVNNQQLLREIMFELGKIKMLESHEKS